MSDLDGELTWEDAVPYGDLGLYNAGRADGVLMTPQFMAGAFHQSILFNPDGGDCPELARFFLQKIRRAAVGMRIPQKLAKERADFINKIACKIREMERSLELLVYHLRSGKEDDEEILEIARVLTKDLTNLNNIKSDKIEAVLQFQLGMDEIQGIVHDGKATIRAVLEYLKILFEEKERAPGIIDRLERNAKQLEDSACQFEQLLVAPDPEAHDLANLLHQGANSVTSLFENKNALRQDLMKSGRYEVPPAIDTRLHVSAPVEVQDPVLAHELNVPRILKTLATNAVNAGASNIRIITEDAGDHTRVIVVNDGEPLPTRDPEQLFARGFSVKFGRHYTHFDSWGDGLSTARKLVQKMGGAFESPVSCPTVEQGGFESGRGGARFSFLLKKAK